MLLRLRAQHCAPVRQTWTSGLEARLNENERDDDDTGTIGSNSGIDSDVGSHSEQRRPHRTQAEQAKLRREPLVAAEAPPPVPGHLADGQRSPEVDPYSPDPSLYPPEWLAEFDRRCKAAVAEMTAAIDRARNER